jgi:O-antigen/teichoic acid export membrane protein
VALTVLSGALARGAGVISTLISIPLTIRYLGLEEYGLWLTISSVIAFFGFADLGIGNGLLNAISEAHGRDDRDIARRYVSSGFFLLSGIALLILAVFWAAYPLIPWPAVFNVKSAAAAREAGPATAALVFCFAASIPLGIVQRVQSGYQEGFASNLWQSAGNIMGLGALLLAIYFHAGLVWLVLAVTGAPVLAAVTNAGVVFGWQRPWLRPRWSSVTGNAARRLFKLGFLFLVLQVAIALAYTSDNIVAAQVLGADVVPQYAVPFRLFAIPSTLLYLLLSPLWPAYGEAISRGDAAWVRRTLRRSMITALLFSAAAAIVLVSTGKLVIRLWAGPQIHPTWLLLVGLGIWTVMAAVGNALSMLLNAMNVVRLQAYCAMIMAVVNLGLSIVLARRIGVPGIIWGTVIAYTLFAVAPLAFYVPSLLRRMHGPTTSLEKI